ncbi:peptidylprolyl isomerase [Namhaeicola litoreus]|uniref:Peptidyl-prolyl cis-trans isomerase n=1 Tax=Namhaeicola litoreus TaxID=1052145 RepID=A0ABW3Y523_9FLAO
MRYFLYFLLATLMILSCSDEKYREESNSKSTTKRTKKIKKAQPLDSINRNNTVAFLKKYGNENRETKAVLHTHFGDIHLKLYEETPLHRANFIFLSKMGYFDTTCFYRVVPNFIIQGGNSENLTTNAMRNSYQNYRIPPEMSVQLKHKYGAVAAARDWEDNPGKVSNPFEFYIIQARSGAHHLDNEHTVFGEVTSGFSVIDIIVNLETGSDEWPLEDVFMRIEVFE